MHELHAFIAKAFPGPDQTLGHDALVCHKEFWRDSFRPSGGCKRCRDSRSLTPLTWSASCGCRPAAHRLEPLDPPTVQRLRNVEIAFRIYGNTVRACDAPQFVASRAAELRQVLPRDS